MKPADAISVLLDRASAADSHPRLIYGTVAAHKLIPTLIAVDIQYEVRWIPVLDATKDATRLAQLETVMPAACREDLPTPLPKGRGGN